VFGAMKIFHCDHCEQLVFFENVQCVNCERALAYVPQLAELVSLEAAGENLWQSRAGNTYRLCQNYSQHNVCNWALPADVPDPLCASCRLTRVIPDLNVPENKPAWYRLEVAKRRMVHTLMTLGLPLSTKTEDPDHGLAFEFLADPATPDAPAILTGHNDGVITISVAEADDAEREKRRLQMHEPYRTLLGHFRHEIGHYYWDRLLRDSDRLDAFRELFGDERRAYAKALQQHYEQGAPGDWQYRFISAYASSHPWEDWAESWAHYLHMTDCLETAAACGLALRPRRPDEPSLKAVPESTRSFKRMIDAWFPLTYALNELNRGMGLADGYPFVISTPAIDKLRFVHETIGA
jgi:hypothetical protein